MNLFCGTEYVKHIKDTAGEVYFDVASFNGRVEECNLTITPASVDFGGNKVMFYFKTFEFQSACDSMNVSVLDGIGRSASIVQGKKYTIKYIRRIFLYFVPKLFSSSLLLLI
jgi:hypothetical protein